MFKKIVKMLCLIEKKCSRNIWMAPQDLTNVPPPGYVQSLISKIISNVKIVCNNLILKYVEDDIVLSLNTRWLCLSPANALWEPAFVESLSLPDLVLRKKLEVKDMTVCLDKRDASGRINIYQEPFCKFFFFRQLCLHENQCFWVPTISWRSREFFISLT